jgi:hypothetical protein
MAWMAGKAKSVYLTVTPQRPIPDCFSQDIF